MVGGGGYMLPMSTPVQTNTVYAQTVAASSTLISPLSSISGCPDKKCAVNETVPTMGRSNEDDAIYEIFYTNPLKCCGVIVEIGAGDGLTGSPSYFFEYGMNWTAILTEADPVVYQKMKNGNRPREETKKIQGGFCRSGSFFYYEDGKFTRRPNQDDVDFISEVHEPNMAITANSQPVNCLRLDRDVLTGVEHVDVFVIRVGGDPFAVLQTMDWAITVDIWIIQMQQQGDTLLSTSRDVLKKNNYVKAGWDVQLWCDNPIDCKPNEVWLRKNVNPLQTQSAGLRGSVIR